MRIGISRTTHQSRRKKSEVGLAVNCSRRKHIGSHNVVYIYALVLWECGSFSPSYSSDSSIQPLDSRILSPFQICDLTKHSLFSL